MAIVQNIDQKFGRITLTANEIQKLGRKMRNRLSAQKSREKKKQYITELESKIRHLSQENIKLKRKLQNSQNLVETKNAKINLLESENKLLSKDLQHINQKIDISKDKIFVKFEESEFRVTEEGSNQKSAALLEKLSPQLDCPLLLILTMILFFNVTTQTVPNFKI
ncbi:hypothetical protein MHBO_000894 [Bonamia ostreae]|uniref:BZIP domain-containing protein n=1 Tax=Bonamia ostreae TaxID=126728 RepID=A0ABV2AH64_9EUKA